MATVHYVVTVEISPTVEAVWLPWYAQTHVRQVLAQPGFLRAVRTRDRETAADGWVRYVTRYELESLQALERYQASDAARRLKEDHLRRYGTTTRVSRQVCEELESQLPQGR